MNQAYSNFLQESIISKEYNVVATFEESDNEFFIVAPGVRIPFDICYDDELYDCLLIAARQRLNMFLVEKRLDELMLESKNTYEV